MSVDALGLSLEMSFEHRKRDNALYNDGCDVYVNVN